jgi:TfoX/Sxy family transcriptional regulator of competence genes
MHQSGNTPETRFAAVIEEILNEPGVTPPTEGNGFGSSALKVENKIFAMLVRGRLVVKLPRERVDALVASGDGERFDANKGRPMKEWLALAEHSQVAWLSLAQEAMKFVRARA